MGKKVNIKTGDTTFRFENSTLGYMKIECGKTTPYFYIEALESGVTVQFYYMPNLGGNPPIINLSYSVDTKNWSAWNNSDIPGDQLFDMLMMTKAGDRIYIKGDNSEAWTKQDNYSYTDIHFTITGRCNLGGSLGSLIDGDDCNDSTEGLMAGMFRENPGIIDISELYIPNGVFSHAHGCENMFSRCSGINRPADMSHVRVIAENTCYNMYYSCENLVSAADISSVTSISRNGCQQMYSGCVSLSFATDMPSLTNIGDYGCSGMYDGCTSLSSAADMPSLSTIADEACGTMYYYCENLTLISNGVLTFDFPAPPVTTTGGTTYETDQDIADWMSGAEYQTNI
jgi:hypothetical protein